MYLPLLKTVALASLASAGPISTIEGVVHTSVTELGQVVDWIMRDSQGDIASTPEPPPGIKQRTSEETARFKALSPDEPALHGPLGTVPMLRGPASYLNKSLPGITDSRKLISGRAGDSYANSHWFVATQQAIQNHGGLATYSLFNPYVENDKDFSVLQTAIVRQNVPLQHGGLGSQAVEAGWINAPSQGAKPHLFSFFTTNDYDSQGDNVGGWNKEVKGFVQTDDSLFPGVAFTTLSEDGGKQYELEIGFYLKGGNWWLWCNDRYIGYYPGSLFSVHADKSQTLESFSDSILYYGEVFQTDESLTTSDLGSGEFPSTGYNKSAYVHNLTYVNTDNGYDPFDGSRTPLIISDASRYNISPTWDPTSSWGNFFYVGGPGAGGKVGS